jgi:hypothetical protein
MSFLSNLVEDLTGQGGRAGNSGAPPSSNPNQGLPPPWVARWDENDQRWFYINEQTGERTWERPGGRYNDPPPRQGYAEQGYGGPPQQQHQQKSHGLAYGAAGVAAGLVGGALLMHEGENIGM